MQNTSDDLTQSSNESIQHYLNTPDLLRDLLLQLTKDFQTAQLPLKLETIEYPSFGGLCDHIVRLLEKHLAEGKTLKNVLIRVDLTEKQIKRAIPGPLSANLLPLAELIIKRELQKVVIRYWYRKAADG